MQTIFLDFEYAVDEHAEEALWSLHILINKEYKSVVSRLKNASHAVERRKAEKIYNNFLRVAQKFYKAYIQRLSARYDIPELTRVARGIDVEPMVADDAISPVAAGLHDKVLQSVHATLIRLGDLARYRVQAKEKKSGYDTVLTYYGLAHQLVPDNGYAYHQMGIVSLAQDNHLDIVYHFYRSWAIKSPHPNAEQNIEREFKAVQSVKQAAAKPQDALIMWFVRLHAFYYKGEQFAQQKELEGEVAHRLKLAIEDPESRIMLLTMTMVNMSAHYIASQRYNEKPNSQPAARFYQYTLRFNIIFLWTVSSFLEKDLRQSITAANNSTEGVSPGKISKAAESAFAILRLYSAWLGAHKQEIFQPNSAIHREVYLLLESLSQVFTLMCVETYGHVDLKTCPYLLSEDLDVLGLEALSIERLPEACRCFCLADGTRKPMLQSSAQRLDSTGEKMSRILDILRCAYFLASDESIPLTQQIVDGYLLFEHNDKTAPATTLVQTSPSTSLMQQAAAPRSEEPASQAQFIEKAPTEIGPDAENTVMNMLTPFLRPPTPEGQQSHSRAERVTSNALPPPSSAAFAAAADVWGSNPIGPAKFAPLPWDWFNTPRPDAGTIAPHRPSAEPSPGISPNRNDKDPFYTPPRPGFQNGGNANTHNDAIHRAQLLQSLTSSRQQLSPQHDDGHSPQLNGGGNYLGGSMLSGFSHPSSLLQGTPGNGMGFGQAGARTHSLGAPFTSPSYAQPTAPQHQQQQQQRQSRLEERTNSYDEAILRSAYHGR